MRILKQLFPPLLLLMILYVQAVSFVLNYEVYESREWLIYLCWVPLLTAPHYFTKKKNVYQIAVTLFFIEGFLNLCHLLLLKGPVTASSIFILLNTNSDEAKEFIDFKFSWLFFFILPYIVLYVIALRKAYSVSAQSKWIVITVLLLSTAFLTENLVNGRFIRKGIPQTAKALASYLKESASYSSLKNRKVMNIKTSRLLPEDSQQHIFVLIIGESGSRNHMSLYNYHRQTNPLLEKRKDIIVYKDAVSPYSNTISSVLSILTESNLENKMSFDTSISLIDVFHSAGYKTYWLSNQSPIGIWENAVYNLAQTAAVSIFVNNKGNSSFESNNVPSYDEKLFQPFQFALNEQEKNKFIVLHLMGSHSAYGKRYPSAYNKFTTYNSGKERLINEYDNSILYNDFIIDSLLNILNSYSIKHNNITASAIYLSDHGENVYDENDNAGHEYSGSIPKSNVEIPFIVWLSPGYQRMYPEKLKTILLNKDHPFVSDDLFHSVLDLNFIECKPFAPERSVFHENFNFKRLRILEDGKDYDLK